MISSKSKKKPEVKNEKDGFESQFENLVKNVLEDLGYVKEADLKDFVAQILEQIEPIISKQIKKHFNEIGTYIVNNTNNNNIVEKKDAEAS